jgi:hypothetical protein
MNTLRIASPPAAFRWPLVNTDSWKWSALVIVALAGSLMLLASRLQLQSSAATLPDLRVTADPSEIISRQAALSAAAKGALPRAPQGTVFTAAIAATVYQIVASDLAYRSPEERAGLMADAPAMTPRVNDLYPTAEGLASFPPLLLQALPQLRANLEYRFMGGYLIVRDSRTNLIVDVLPDPIVEGATS